MAQPARPYDALYDGTYTVSGARDHYRQQTVAGGFMLERAPHYPDMFSVLPNHPASTYRLKNSDKIPAFIDRAFHPHISNPAELTLCSQPEQVSGQQRYKYFRRPMLAALEPPVIIKQAAPAFTPSPVPLHASEPHSKTVGTQSDYRESEAQTLPWEPAIKLPEDPTLKQKYLSSRFNCDGPELLQLQDLKFGDGLPPGLQEVRRINKMREKRAFEATLPPLHDLQQLPLRQRMIEAWENKEWQEREEEILSVQDERLGLLESALAVREEEYDEATLQRVEERRTAMLQDRSTRFAIIQSNRIKTMRQLIEARKYVEKPRKLHKPTIVEQYANYGSTTYAPIQREGRFPETKPQGKVIETEGYQPVSLQGINELEAFLPARLLQPKAHVPRKPSKLDYKQRQDVAIQKDLRCINDLLDTAKATKGRGFGDCWPAPLKDTADDSRPTRKSTIRLSERPSTPVLPPPASVVSKREAAVVLLQRLLRGRAAQNIMYEGRMRRLELIQELRLEEQGQASVKRPEDLDPTSAKLDELVGMMLSDLFVVLTGHDVIRRATMIAAIASSHKPLTPPAKRPIASFAAANSATAPQVQKPLDPGEAAAAAAEARLAAAVAASAAAVAPAANSNEAEAEAAAAVAAKTRSAVDPSSIVPREPDWEALGITEEDAEQAAVRIQAAFKGHQGRKCVAALRANSSKTCNIGLLDPAHNPDRDSGMGTAPESDMPNANDAMYEQPASNKHSAVDPSTIVPVPPDLDALGITKDQAEHAAVRIQAAFKGHVGRKRAAAMRVAEDSALPDSNAGAAAAAGAAADTTDDVDNAALTEMNALTTATDAADATEAANDVNGAFTSASPQPEAGTSDSQTENLPETSKHSGVDPSTIVPKAPDLEALGITEDQAEQAAVRIQAAFKGHQGRKRVAALRTTAAQPDEPHSYDADPTLGTDALEGDVAAATTAAEDDLQERTEHSGKAVTESAQIARASPSEPDAFPDLEPSFKDPQLPPEAAAPQTSSTNAPDDMEAVAHRHATAGTISGVDLEEALASTPDLEDIKIKGLARGRQARKQVQAMQQQQEQQEEQQEEEQEQEEGDKEPQEAGDDKQDDAYHSSSPTGDAPATAVEDLQQDE